MLTAVTSPSELTDAMAGLALDEVTTRPVSTLLPASKSDTWSCTVAPIWSVDDAGDTDTDATGTGVVELEATTVSVAAPLLYPRVATMEAEPGDLALTSPDPETVANEESLVLQTTASDSGLL
jgi:hypothetical protein